MALDTPVLEDRLPQLTPFATLGPPARERLLTHARTLEMRPGFRLHARDDHRHLLFLLQGRMIVTRAGRAQRIEAGTPRALAPLFGERDYDSHALATTPGTLAVFDRMLYRMLLDEGRDNIELREVELSGLESELFTDVYTRIVSGELALPRLPTAALQLQGGLDDRPDADAHVAAVIAADPDLAARLLRVAGHPALGTEEAPADLRAAVARLGPARSRLLVLALAGHELFAASTTPWPHLLRRLWRRSTRVAAISCTLADLGGAADPAQALLAGQLHRVGALPLVTELARTHPECRTDEVERILLRLEGLIGELVARQWGLASVIMEAIRDSGGPETADSNSLTDVLRVARSACSRDLARDAPVDHTPLRDLPAVRRLGLELDADGRLPALDAARHSVDALLRQIHREPRANTE